MSITIKKDGAVRIVSEIAFEKKFKPLGYTIVKEPEAKEKKAKKEEPKE